MTDHPATSIVRTLLPDDVTRLRLGFGAGSAAAEARRMLEIYPGRSVWAPDTLEYALLAPWRHRPEIAHVQQLVAVRHPVALLRGAIDRCSALGDALLLVIELSETRLPTFYARAGLDPLEEVITYELDPPRAVTVGSRRLRFRPVRPREGSDLEMLLRLDHAAFPWIWWNSREEFLVYGETPGVRLYLGSVDGVPVCYVGVTLFAGWGHLDRIAVAPDQQGRGFGGEALAFAIDAVLRSGARRIGLSTQRDNVRSQRLYERFGFRRSPGYDYRLYGAQLRPRPGCSMDDETPRTG